jgi:hypothetical protein
MLSSHLSVDLATALELLAIFLVTGHTLSYIDRDSAIHSHSHPITALPTPSVVKWRAPSRGRVGVGERMAGLSSSFRGPEWWRHVRRLHTKVVAIDAATAATHRWMSGTRGRRVGSVWGNGRPGRPRLSGGPSGRGAFVAHTPKSSPLIPPPPPLIGGRAVHAVKGSDRWRGADGMWWSSSFSGVGVRGLRWVATECHGTPPTRLRAQGV